jgi:hypothetical protein
VQVVGPAVAGLLLAKITDDLDVLLTFYDYPALRHEAPHDRVGVRDPHRWAVAAA